ncbi:uncharacterized protein LOC131309384 [Rhododendron vialii]|uniref:uncharacterized protein LOC131309384 n=1 Tax=Rhododendron vialii TaxID=182163 RepID=UPI00265FA348|nr:uncharacterized protein LOC131309384 [Rhododendron vialii]
MVFIQETKLVNIDVFVVRSMWGSGDFDFSCSNASGTSGGLLVIWKKDFFIVTNVICNRSFILLQGVINNEFQCFMVNIYAPNDVVSRRGVWEELLVLKSNSNVAWCIGGDFNEIRTISERVRCQRMERGMKDFFDFGNRMELLDIPMLGRKFTWTNYQNRAVNSRLDRFLISQQWLAKFKVVQWGIHRPISDHCPIVLIDDSRDWGPRPFRFMDIWLSNPRCMKIAQETWENTPMSGWAGFRILQKLRAVKDKLKVWNKEEFGDVNSALQETEAEIHQFDLVVEDRQLSVEEKAWDVKLNRNFGDSLGYPNLYGDKNPD